MNPEFLVVNKKMTQKDFMDAVREAKALLSVITSETVIMVAQNLHYCEESPQMAELAKKDALTAVVELTDQATRLKSIIVKMQGCVLT